MDRLQNTFENFEVPDPIRIIKALRLIRASHANVSGINVLECGATKGGVADYLSREGAVCYGVDVNPREIAGVHMQRADLNNGIPNFGRQFEVVFAGEVIEHIFDDEHFLKECYRVLRPGGLLVLTTPNLVFCVNRLRMLFGAMPVFAYAPYHYHFYNKKTLLEIIKKTEFEIVGLTSSHTLFSTRRNKLGKAFEILGDWFPSLGAHLIVAAQKPKN